MVEGHPLQRFFGDDAFPPPEFPRCRKYGCGNVADPDDFKFCLEHKPIRPLPRSRVH